MFARISSPRCVLVLLLIVATFFATVQAKRGVYYPERSAHGIIAKTIKLVETRIERVHVEPLVLPEAPLVVVSSGAELRAPEQETQDATFPAFLQALWFRPPPSFA